MRIEDPDDLDAYLVYADWLMARGDPHGELIAVHVALERSNDEALAQREQVLIERLLGDLAGAADQISWLRGFVQAIRWCDAGVLRGVLALPIARLVREIEIGDWSPRHEPGEYEAALGDLSALWKCVHLESVALTGCVQSFGVIVAPKLRHFEWKTFGPEPGWQGSCDENLSAITSAKWPALETLDLWFARGDGYDSKRLWWMRKLLAGEGLGKLKHLALRQFALWPDALRSELEHARILPQLETLDLSGTLNVDETTRRALRALRDRPAFRHLQSFEI
jgi:uncharacterized protein (TIGR02996 family)